MFWDSWPPLAVSPIARLRVVVQLETASWLSIPGNDECVLGSALEVENGRSSLCAAS